MQNAHISQVFIDSLQSPNSQDTNRFGWKSTVFVHFKVKCKHFIEINFWALAMSLVSFYRKTKKLWKATALCQHSPYAWYGKILDPPLPAIETSLNTRHRKMLESEEGNEFLVWLEVNKSSVCISLPTSTLSICNSNPPVTQRIMVCNVIIQNGDTEIVFKGSSVGSNIFRGTPNSRRGGGDFW